MEPVFPAANMGGVVAVISEEAEGESTFTLSFPRSNPRDYRESIYFCQPNLAEIKGRVR